MSSLTPMVSIIIPTYNSARFLSDAINSALAQTYQNIEVIVVDDGSTDDTPNIVAEYKGRIAYVSQANGGTASARNAGIDASNGQYLVFLDADDRLLPHMVERLVGILETEREAEVGCGGWYVTDSEFNRIGESRVDPPRGRLFEAMIRDGGYLVTGGTMLRRSIIEVAGAFDTSLPNFEDWEFWVRLAYYGRFAFVSEPLMEYRQLPTSRSRAFSNFSASTAAVSAKIYTFLREHGESPELGRLAKTNRRNLRRSLLAQNCFISHWSGSPVDALGYAWGAILCSPGNLFNRGIWSVLIRSLACVQREKWFRGYTSLDGAPSREERLVRK